MQTSVVDSLVLGKNYICEFDTVGSHLVRANLSNNLDETVYIELDADLIWPITDFYLSVRPSIPSSHKIWLSIEKPQYPSE